MGNTLRTIEAALWICALAAGIGFVSLYAEGKLPGLFKAVRTEQSPRQRERIEDLLGPAGTPRPPKASDSSPARAVDGGSKEAPEKESRSSASKATTVTDSKPTNNSSVPPAASKEPAAAQPQPKVVTASVKNPAQLPAPRFFPSVRSGWPFALTPEERSGHAATETSRYSENGTAVYFQFGSSELSASARKALDKAADEAASKPKATVTVRGFTDGVGPVCGNATLSELRAKSVSRHLISRGVAPRRISLFGLGPQNSFASNETALGRTLNRRAEVLIGD